MDRLEKDQLISQISSGVLIYPDKGRFLYIKPATSLLRQESYLYYSAIIDECMFEDWLTSDEAVQVSINNDLYKKEDEERLKAIEKQIDGLKEDMFLKRILEPKRVSLNRKNIRQLEKTAATILAGKHAFDHMTAEGFAELCRQGYILRESIFDKQGNKVSIDEDSPLYEKISGFVVQSYVSPEKAREIARTDPWRSYWNAANGNNPFGGAIIDYTDSQRALISFSVYYDNVWKHPECPTEDVVNDDDMLDGWAIIQRKKSGEQGKKEIVPGDDGESDLFLVAKNEEHRRKIDSMNDQQGRELKIQREKTIQKKGKLTEDQFIDVQANLREQAKQNILNRRKNG